MRTGALEWRLLVADAARRYRRSADGMPALSMPIVGSSIGIAAGSHF